MIRTITLNTGFDETFVVSRTLFGGVEDVTDHRVRPSGKGVNAAWTLRSLGLSVHVYGLVGREDHDLFRKDLADKGIPCTLAEVDGTTRRNLTLLSLAERQPAAHFRAPGFRLADQTALDTLLARLADDCRAGDVVSLHGSTPAGAAAGSWARFARRARDRGAKVVVDVYGAALLDVLDGCEIQVCKPNQDEMRIFPSAASLPLMEAARTALVYMRARCVALPIVSLGSDGLVYEDAGRMCRASADVAEPRILVGAGDACMAGIMAGLSAPDRSTMGVVKQGVATASAHVEGCADADLPERAAQLLAAVQIEDLGPL